MEYGRYPGHTALAPVSRLTLNLAHPYNVDWRNARSRFSLSLHVSYPDAADIQRAKSAGYSPGHNIMIHGLPNGWGWLAPLFRRMDWTDGCIAVTNSEMREIWARTPTGTPVIIEK